MFFDDAQENDKKGTVFNIEKYHINDGEGIRTNVFLKGCNLWCQWCCNPESQCLYPQLVIHTRLCKRCGYCCQGICDQNANYIDSTGNVYIDIEKCKLCSKCISVCPCSARELYGREMSVADVMKEVEKDSAYYIQSNGGMTITGGEPCIQADFSRQLIIAAKSRFINAAIETAGAVNWEQLWKIAEFSDTILFDIKYTDASKFSSISTTPLEIVYNNLYNLRKNKKEVKLRCPIIPDKNDNITHIKNIVQLAKETNILEVDLLPFHQFGKYKYDSLKYVYKLADTPEMDKSKVALFKEDMIKQGLKVTIGG
jgi:pyruvate formate lyase activating enzyme